MRKFYLSLDTLQSDVGDWSKREFPDKTLDRGVLKLCEEAGEVAAAAVKRQENRDDGIDWDKRLQKECADVLIALLGVAEQAGFSLIEVTDEHWDQVRERRFATRDH